MTKELHRTINTNRKLLLHRTTIAKYKKPQILQIILLNCLYAMQMTKINKTCQSQQNYSDVDYFYMDIILDKNQLHKQSYHDK